jgi:hypothetical protein
MDLFYSLALVMRLFLGLAWRVAWLAGWRGFDRTIFSFSLATGRCIITPSPMCLSRLFIPLSHTHASIVARVLSPRPSGHPRVLSIGNEMDDKCT